MELDNIKQLAAQLDSIRSPLGTDIYECAYKTLEYISEWKPDFVYYVESITSENPIVINKVEKKPTQEQIDSIIEEAVKLYSAKTIDILNSYIEYFRQNKDVTVVSIEKYVAQFSSLMQLITLPNFDSKLVASLSKYHCLVYDNVFYLLDDILNSKISWNLFNNYLYEGRLFKIYHIDVENFIDYNVLNEWASFYYSSYIDYEDRPDPIKPIDFPSHTFNTILEYNSSKTDTTTEIDNIISDISQVNTDIITFLTYNDFDIKNQNPTTPELNVIVPPSKEDLLTKVYKKHKVNDMYTYLGYPEKCMYNKEDKIQYVQEYHKSLNITRDNILKEVNRHGETKTNSTI